jgi:hypothetical protein
MLSATALMTSVDVHYGLASQIIEQRPAVLDFAYLFHPECFVNQAP